MQTVRIENVRERIDTVQDIGTLPDVMANILSIVEDDSSTALDLASVVARDQALTLRILRAVNSAYYGLRREVLTVPEAVVLLGFDEIERLALSILVIDTLGLDRERVQALKMLWRHSVACSVAGTVLEQHYSRSLSGIRGVHVACLLHDIGKAVIAQCFPEAFLPILHLTDEEGLSILNAERTVLGGFTHCEVGAWIAERWGLPPAVVQSITYHHDPDAVSEGYSEIVQATHLANEICNRFGIRTSDRELGSVFGLHLGKALPLDDTLIGNIRASLHQSRSTIGAVASGAMF